MGSLLRRVFRLTFPSFQREKWKDKIETANLPLAGFISDESSVSDKFPARDGFSVSDMNSAIVPVVISIAYSPRVASHSCGTLRESCYISPTGCGEYFLEIFQ